MLCRAQHPPRTGYRTHRSLPFPVGDDEPWVDAGAGRFVAIPLRFVGLLPARRRGLAADTFTRRGRVLSEDHPDTHAAANNLALALYEPGEATR
jgi:hypothetical protein